MAPFFKFVIGAAVGSEVTVFGYVWRDSGDPVVAFVVAALLFVFMWGFPIMFLAAEEEIKTYAKKD